MVNKNILAKVEKEFLEEEKEDLENGIPSQKCKLIIYYLNSLPYEDIVEVIPSLYFWGTRDREVFEDYIFILLREIFMDCTTASEVISLADKLIYDISTEKENIFEKIVSDYALEDLGEDLLLKIAHDRTATDKQKVCRKVCERLCSELIKYTHPYVSGVLNRKSILCELFREQCQKEGFELKRP